MPLKERQPHVFTKTNSSPHLSHFAFEVIHPTISSLLQNPPHESVRYAIICLYELIFVEEDKQNSVNLELNQESYHFLSLLQRIQILAEHLGVWLIGLIKTHNALLSSL